MALNNVEYAGVDTAGQNGTFRGYISPDQLYWLERELALVPRDRLIVLATHIPLVAEASDGRSPVATGPGTENLAPLLELLAPFARIYSPGLPTLWPRPGVTAGRWARPTCGACATP